MAKQPIIVTVLAGFKGDGLKKAQKQLQGLGDSVNKLSANALKAGAGVAISKGFQLFNSVAEQSITQARDLERNLAALNTVFGDLAPRMRSFAEGATSVGLSQAEAAKASVFLGSVLKQSGFSIEETAKQTQRLVELGADLSLTYGYDVQEALLGMTALFRGEYDPIEKFGVAMKQSEINAELAAQKLDHLEGAERRLAEQQIRLNLLFERSTDAQGAFQRQSGTLAVEQEKLQASINNMLQRAGTPLLGVLGELAAALVPITEDLTPTLTAVFEDLASKVEIAVKDTKGLKDAIQEAAIAISGIIQVTSSLALFLLQNARAVSFLVGAFLAFKAASKAVYLVTAAITTYKAAVAAATTATVALNVATKASIFGAVAAGIVLLGGALLNYKDILGITDEAENEANYTRKQTLDRISQLKSEINSINTAISNGVADASAYESQLKTLNEELRRLEGAANAAATQVTGIGNAFSFSAGEANRFANLEKGFVAEYKPPALAPETGGEGSGGEQAKDYVKEFYDKLTDEVKKQAARVRLQAMGASEGLISSILSGEGWEKVFKRIVDRGIKEVKRLQKVFETTADGIKELADALEAELERIEESYKERIDNQEAAISKLESAYESIQEAVSATGDSFSKFFDEFSVLPTTEQEIGRFESHAISSLENIKGMLDSTLATLGEDFRESYNQLLSYATSELEVIRGIQRERDRLAEKRSLAESLMGDVKAATVGAANITSLFSKAQTAAEKVKATEVIAETIKAGRDLKEFRVTVIRDIVEPLATAGQVVDGFKDIVAKTRAFIENLKSLRALGLDPQLFNQLVQAGVEAGGETAQALVDGGSETITELNGLFKELNQLGGELGEETAQVMYGAGVDLTNGIIAGIAAEQSKLEEQANILADAFGIVFKTELEVALDSVLNAIRLRIDEAKAELARILAEMEAAKAAASRAAEQAKTIVAPPAPAPAPAPSSGAGSDKGKSPIKAPSADGKITLPKTPTPAELIALPIGSVKAPLTPEMQKIVAGDKKGITNINVNVKTDPTKSPAQVGKDVTKTIMDYLNNGGKSASGGGGGVKYRPL